MVFSSPVFLLVFLPIVLFINKLLPNRARNVFLLIANIFFYAYGEPIYILLMAASIIFNYYAGMFMEKSMSDKHRKAMLIFAIVMNIGVLCFYKYTVLIADTLRQIPVFASIPEFELRLPVGISFYTFQAVSYVIDIYRGECRRSESFVNFAAYISLFPQLIAGPIVRYCDVERQLRERHESGLMFATGVRLFAIGLAKKVLLANQFGIVWDTVSKEVASFGTIGAWIGAIAFSLEIYFDFAGYSDMARGLGKMLGFDFCMNFNYPYISKSITEFWRRWHMSLGTWFRDYVYIPLGGNRVKKGRLCFNLLFVWMLTGLWHGAGWNFLAWGLYYGIILLLEKTIYGEKLKKLPSVFGHLYAMVLVIVGWIFFASESFKDAFEYLRVMFIPCDGDILSLAGWSVTIIIGIIGSTPLVCSAWTAMKGKRKLTVTETVLCAAAIILCVASLVTDSYNPFLYFRF